MTGLTRAVREAGKRAIWEVFVRGQRLGVDVLPRHFYSAIPDLGELRRSHAWRAPRSMVGIAGTDVGRQLTFLEQVCRPHAAKLSASTIHAEACAANGEEGFGPIEADVLYAVAATRALRRVIQVGAGVSTQVLLRAKRSFALDLAITCIDPFPSPGLRTLEREGAIELISAPVQEVSVEHLAQSGPDTLFFVDSTHTVKAGSDVNWIVLEVLPRLSKGTLVHFHDIYFPYDYPRDILQGDLFFANESVLLQAFLTHNSRYGILASLSMLHYAAPAALQRLVPAYQPAPNDDGLATGPGHFPSSLYLEVVA